MESHLHLLSVLTSSFLFRGLNSQQLQELAQKTRFYTYRPGQILIEEDVTNDKVILIVDGLVKIYRITPEGKEIFLAFEKNNDYIGVMDLDDQPGSATIEALKTTKVLVFYKKDLNTLLKQYPHLWERMYKIILAKFEDMKHFHSIRLGNDLYERTHLLLQYLSEHSDNKTVILSQETLASIVGATRPRVTETLHALQKAGKIQISSKKIVLLS